MSVGKLALKAALMTSIVAMPTLVHAADASKLSVASAVSGTRAGVDQQGENQLGGGIIIPLLALAAIIGGILVVLKDDNDTVSP